MNISKNGIDLIKSFEGFRPKAYLDPVRIPTIGYGTIRYSNGIKVKLGDIITDKEALKELANHIDTQVIPKVVDLIKVKLNQNQLDALISLIYNIGIDAFSKSTLLKKINSEATVDEIGEQFSRWNKAGGKVLPGLVKRRNSEFLLYSTGKLVLNA